MGQHIVGRFEGIRLDIQFQRIAYSLNHKIRTSKLISVDYTAVRAVCAGASVTAGGAVGDHRAA
jgi:hypothetical protein